MNPNDTDFIVDYLSEIVKAVRDRLPEDEKKFVNLFNEEHKKFAVHSGITYVDIAKSIKSEYVIHIHKIMPTTYAWFYWSVAQEFSLYEDKFDEVINIFINNYEKADKDKIKLWRDSSRLR